jgi:hypothetical protein
VRVRFGRRAWAYDESAWQGSADRERASVDGKIATDRHRGRIEPEDVPSEGGVAWLLTAQVKAVVTSVLVGESLCLSGPSQVVISLGT